MRKLRPYISIERVHGNEYIVHALVYLEDNQKLRSNKLQPRGKVSKGRHADLGNPEDRTKFVIEIDSAPGTINTQPVHLTSDKFTRHKGVRNVWVFCETPVDGNPDEGGVGDYDDPDP